MPRMLQVVGGIVVLGAALWFLASPRPMETPTVWLLAAGGGLGLRVVMRGISLSPWLQRGLFYGGAAVLVVALNAFPFLPHWSRYVNLLALAGLAASVVGAPLKEWWSHRMGLPAPHTEEATRPPDDRPLSIRRRIFRGLGAFILGMFGGLALAAVIDYLVLYGGVPAEVYGLLMFGTGGLACGMRAGGGWRIGLYSGLVASIIPVLVTLPWLTQENRSGMLEQIAPAVVIVWASAMLGGYLKERFGVPLQRIAEFLEKNRRSFGD